MKKSTLAAVAITLISVVFTGGLVAQTVTVSGAGNSSVNGDYVYLMQFDGKNYYQQTTSPSGILYWTTGYSPPAWKIAAGGGQGYYLNTNNTSAPPATGWQVDNTYGPGGDLPVPTLTGDVDVLPIQLASLSALLKGNAVEIQWSTVSEVNNYGFYVQRRSLQQLSFADLPNGFVAGAGTTLEARQYSWTDESNVAGTFYYRLRQVELNGVSTYSHEIRVEIALGVSESVLPRRFSLDQNYPNPFNPSTTIRFNVDRREHARLEVFDVLGEEVARLFDRTAEPGRYYELTFDASGLGSGVYFYLLSTNSHHDVKKLLLLK